MLKIVDGMELELMRIGIWCRIQELKSKLIMIVCRRRMDLLRVDDEDVGHMKGIRA